MYILLRHRSRHTVEMDTGKDWSEEMRPMVYTQEMRANHEICPYCGTWHTAMSCPPQFAISTLRILDLEEKVTTLTASRNSWRKLAESLGKEWVANFDGDLYCVHCNESVCEITEDDIIKNDCAHDPDCPIEQLRKMKEGEG